MNEENSPPSPVTNKLSITKKHSNTHPNQKPKKKKSRPTISGLKRKKSSSRKSRKKKKRVEPATFNLDDNKDPIISEPEPENRDVSLISDKTPDSIPRDEPRDELLLEDWKDWKDVSPGSGAAQKINPVPNQTPPTKQKKKSAISPSLKTLQLLLDIALSQPVFVRVETGVDVLFGTNELYVIEILDLCEKINGFDTRNCYNILNSNRQRLFYAAEKLNGAERNCFGRPKTVNMNLFNMYGEPSIVVQRDYNYSLCFWGRKTLGSNIQVTVPSTGQVLGTVKQNCSYSTPRFSVYDESGKLAKIFGPSCGSCCELSHMKKEAVFELVAEGRLKNNSAIHATIHKRLINSGKVYSLSFNEDSEFTPQIKALILSSIFAIDFAYFEKQSSCCDFKTGFNFLVLIMVLLLVILIVITLVIVFVIIKYK